MKKIKSILFILITSTMLSCGIFKNVTDHSIFSIDAIQADKDFYTKAVLEHHFINRVFRDFSVGEKKCDSTHILRPSQKMKKKHLYAEHKSKADSILLDCRFDVPEDIEDLKSGFQYRYYSFSSTNSAALQAFGITDIDHNFETKYLVIDYIQFQDISCSNIPTIRYAVGLRSELRIKKSDTKIDLTKKGLAELAAKVELGEASINFSLKTIGLTGKPARFNIPQGVSFNVTTYKNYQNAIEFLKSNLKEKMNDSVAAGERLYVNPELIPVMDEYRPNTKNSIDALSKKLIQMHKEMDKVRRKFRIRRADSTSRASNNVVLTETGNQLLKFYKKQAEKVISNYDSVMDKTEEKDAILWGKLLGFQEKIDQIKNKFQIVNHDKIALTESGYEIIELYRKEIKRLIAEQEALHGINKKVYSIQQYENFLINAVPEKQAKQYKKKNDLEGYEEYSEQLKNKSTGYEDMFGVFPGKKHLNTLGYNDLIDLEDIYYDSDNLSYADFDQFLNIINQPEIVKDDLKTIVKKLQEIQEMRSPNKSDLVELAKEIIGEMDNRRGSN